MMEKHKSLEHFRAYLEDLIAIIRDQPYAGLDSEMLQLQSESGLSGEEIISTIVLLAATAQESTKSLIGNGLLALLRNPFSISELRADRSLIPAAVNELLRYDSPIQYVSPCADEDVQVADKWIRKGEYVLIYMGAANRDPARFTEPDRLNFRRTTRNLAFGADLHRCVGSYLAKLEMEIVLGALLERFSNLELASECLQRSPSRISRRLTSLHITLHL